MINELDDVILTCDLPEGYEVEFTTLDGNTIAVAPLMADQVRPAQAGEIAHARELTAR